MRILKKIITTLLFFIIITANILSAQEEDMLNELVEEVINNPANFSKVIFEFNSDSALLVINYDFLNKIMISTNDTLSLPAGEYIFELSKPLSPQQSKRTFLTLKSLVKLKFQFPTENISINSLNNNYASKEYFDSNIFILSDLDSDIYYNNQLIGTGFAKISPPYGKTEFTINNPDFGTRKIQVNSLPFLKVHEAYRRPVEKYSRGLSIFPGASQFYKRQHLKSILISSISAALVYSYVRKSVDYQNELKLFKDLENRYEKVTNESDAVRIGNLVEEQLETLKEKETNIRQLLGVFSLVYIYNVFDGLKSKPEGGFRKKKPLDLYLVNEQTLVGNINQATLKYNF